ncbi:MAG: GNAT family N-acetyltransferase [Candidatus Bathyarchaeia archaeon]
MFVKASVEMRIENVTETGLLRVCRRFLAQDPVANVLVLGDLYAPLLGVSDVYAAFQNSRLVGVCAVFCGYSKPSIVFGAETPEAKHALIETAVNRDSNEFISLCSPNDARLFEECSIILHQHSEQQMVADPPKQIKCEGAKVEKVDENELEALDKFYRQHHAEAWIPMQLKVGLYYWVRQDGKIVSAAGVHVVTPHVAQLGNIVTDEAYRNRGYATACTSVLAADLASKGRIISLFVKTNNHSAIRMYKKLGFRKVREVEFLVLKKKNA